ncbi:metallophosphoesterase [Shinella sp.]|uniref:metallophosphoesterase n=1 Tax=Shinella sp. TaxID=1870904 RepID=UPI003F72692E
MTGIWVMSDLHVNTAPFELPPTPVDADVLVVAGDVGEGWHQSLRWLFRAARRGLPVVFVPGNHEWYGYDLLDDRREELAHLGVHLLEPHSPVEIASVRFIGGTLWTDYAIEGDSAAALWWAKTSYPDFWNIDVGMRRLRPTDLLDAHRLQLAGIEADLAQEFDGSTIVVTHHAPHPGSLVEGFSRESAGSYASDLTHLIQRYKPTLWVHGHVHQSFDYVVEGDDASTRVVCNPRGYAPTRSDGSRAGNPNFLTDLVVEVDDPELCDTPRFR